MLNAASAQLSNWIGLPSGVAAALAGGNLIYESSCTTAALLGASFEGFVLDDEMHAMTYGAMERDYHYPSLADRETPRTWEQSGAQTA